jgi:nicotinamide N-methyltransferase
VCLIPLSRADGRWNTARVTSTFLLRHPGIVRDKRVVELGAGGGLPSIISALAGAEYTVMTDYPEQSLHENMVFNVEGNVLGSQREKIHVVVRSHRGVD